MVSLTVCTNRFFTGIILWFWLDFLSAEVKNEEVGSLCCVVEWVSGGQLQRF